jgi:hypothetical protein
MSPVNRSRSTSPADSISSGIGLAPYTYTHGGGGFALHESHIVDGASNADRFSPSSSPAPAPPHDTQHFLHPGRRATLHSGPASGFEPMETESTPSKQRPSQQQHKGQASPCVHAAVWTIMAAVVVAALIAVAMVGERWVSHAAKHDAANGAPPPLTATAMHVKAAILPDAVHAAVTKHLVGEHLSATRTTTAATKNAAVTPAKTVMTASAQAKPASAAKATLIPATKAAPVTTAPVATRAKKSKTIKSAKPIKMTARVEPKMAKSAAKTAVLPTAAAKAAKALSAQMKPSAKRAQTIAVKKVASLTAAPAAPTKSIARKPVEKHVVKAKKAPAAAAAVTIAKTKIQREQKVQLSNAIAELTADHIMDELAAQHNDPGMRDFRLIAF